MRIMEKQQERLCFGDPFAGSLSVVRALCRKMFSHTILVCEQRQVNAGERSNLVLIPVSWVYLDQQKPAAGLIMFKLDLGNAAVPAGPKHGHSGSLHSFNFAQLNSATGSE
jgi:hypothetical protein